MNCPLNKLLSYGQCVLSDKLLKKKKKKKKQQQKNKQKKTLFYSSRI